MATPPLREIARKALRTSAMACGAAGGLVLAQLGWLAATYKTPPEAPGPRQGIVRSSSRAKEDALHWTVPHSWRPESLGRSFAAQSVSEAGTSTSGSSDEHLRVLFIGDSLVTGVGCDSGEGPTIAKRFAQVTSGESWRPNAQPLRRNLFILSEYLQYLRTRGRFESQRAAGGVTWASLLGSMKI